MSKIFDMAKLACQNNFINFFKYFLNFFDVALLLIQKNFKKNFVHHQLQSISFRGQFFLTLSIFFSPFFKIPNPKNKKPKSKNKKNYPEKSKTQTSNPKNLLIFSSFLFLQLLFFFLFSFSFSAVSLLLLFFFFDLFSLRACRFAKKWQLI
jgi:hypothetical protein